MAFGGRQAVVGRRCGCRVQRIEHGQLRIKPLGVEQRLVECSAPRRGVIARRRGLAGAGCRIAQRRQVVAFVAAGGTGSTGLEQPAPRLPRLFVPALELPLGFGTLGHQLRQPRAQLGVGAALRWVEQRRVQRAPGAVDVDDAIRRDQRLVEQRTGGLDQLRRAGAGLALRHAGLVALFGQAVDAAVVVSKPALGAFQRRLAGQRGHRGQLRLQRHIGVRQRQQRVVVAQRRLQLRGEFVGRCCARARRRCCGGGGDGRWWRLCGSRRRLFVESPADHGCVFSGVKAMGRIVRRRPGRTVLGAVRRGWRSRRPFWTIGPSVHHGVGHAGVNQGDQHDGTRQTLQGVRRCGRGRAKAMT